MRIARDGMHSEPILPPQAEQTQQTQRRRRLRMQNWYSRSVVLLAVLALTCASILAQDITRGSLAGVVRDQTGAVVAGATVKLSSPSGDRETSTGPGGEYLFLNLVPGGGYSVSVEQPGFSVAKASGITIRLAQRSTVDLTLEVGQAAQSVEVTAQGAELIDLQSTAIGATVTESLYENVPVGRNISALIQMAPGVVDSGGAGAANPSINGASGLENQYIINGANTTDPGFGGFGTYSRQYGSLGTGINFDFIQEVQVRSGGFEAQYGQALGGVVNVITKTGTNEYHGGVYAYFSPQQFERARPNPWDYNTETVRPRVLNTGTYDFGFDIGGWLVKDKLFWYGGFNPQYNHAYRLAPPEFSNASLGPVDIRTRILNYTGKVNYNISSNHQVEGSVFGDPSDVPVGFTRFTSLAADDDLRASGLDYGSRTWTGRYTGVLSRNWIFTANYSNYFNKFTETPKYQGYQITDNVPVQERTGTQRIYGGLGFLENTESRADQINAMTTWNANVLGTHQIDLGYGWEDIEYDDFQRRTGADFAIPSRPEFGETAGLTQYGATLIRTHVDPADLSSPVVLRVTRGNYSNPSVVTNTKYHSAFIQDSWNIGNRVTIKPGVRWEYQRMRGTINSYTFAGNWAPRIGFTIDPTGSRRQKIFANWGRFFEKIPLDIAVRAFSAESEVRGALYRDQPGGTVSLGPENYVGNLYPSTNYTTSGAGQALRFTGGSTATTIVAGGTKSQYQDEIVAGYEREFGGGTAISARFVHRSLRRILEDISPISVTQALAHVEQQYVISNPSASLDLIKNGVPCTGGPGCDPATGFNADAGQLTPDGSPDGFPNASRIYRALQVQFTRRFNTNFQLFANYTLSKLHGNYEGLFRNDNLQQDPNITSLFDFTNSDGLLTDQFQPGVLPGDRRHVAKIFGNYQVTEGFLKNLNMAVGWNIQTGTPISEFLAHPAYDNAGEIPVGGRGKLGRTATTLPLDVQLAYGFNLGGSETKRIKFIADLFNVFNHRKVTRVSQDRELDSTTPNPDFLKPDIFNYQYPFQTPFRARLAVRFEF
jgi:hypothetical protein